MSFNLYLRIIMPNYALFYAYMLRISLDLAPILIAVQPWIICGCILECE